MTDVIPWVKWRFDRWRADEGLRMCGLAARGLWADLLAIMHGCQPYGHLAINGQQPSARQIASMVGMTTEKEIAVLLEELETSGVFSRSAAGLIYSRRLVRDNAARIQGRATGSSGGNPVLLKQVNERQRKRLTKPVELELTGTEEIGLTPPDNPEKREERERRETDLRSVGQTYQLRNEFEHEFWPIYPRKVAKDAALKAWLKARKLAETADIIAGLRLYRFSPERDYQPHASTWLNEGRWKTEPDTAPPRSLLDDYTPPARGVSV